MNENPNRRYNPTKFWESEGMANQALKELDALPRGSREVGLRAAYHHINRVNFEGMPELVAKGVAEHLGTASVIALEINEKSKLQRLVTQAYIGFVGAANELFNSQEYGGVPADRDADMVQLLEIRDAFRDASNTLRVYANKHVKGERIVENMMNFISLSRAFSGA